MARDRIGLASWEDLSETEKNKFIEMEIWRKEVYDKFVSDKLQAEENKVASSKKKQKRRRGAADADEDEYIE